MYKPSMVQSENAQTQCGPVRGCTSPVWSSLGMHKSTGVQYSQTQGAPQGSSTPSEITSQLWDLQWNIHEASVRAKHGPGLSKCQVQCWTYMVSYPFHLAFHVWGRYNYSYLWGAEGLSNFQVTEEVWGRGDMFSQAYLIPTPPQFRKLTPPSHSTLTTTTNKVMNSYQGLEAS